MHFAFTVARWARLGSDDVESRAYTLAGDLHQSELAKRENVVAGTVVSHHLTHVVVKSLSVLSLSHVDVVDDDDSTHIAQAQLAGDFIGSTKVHIEGVVLLAG